MAESHKGYNVPYFIAKLCPHVKGGHNPNTCVIISESQL